MTNSTGRCRLHGGKSTGRPPKHGRLTRANLLQRDWLRLLLGAIALQEGIELKNFRPEAMTAARAEVRLLAMSVRLVIEGLEAFYPGIAARALTDDSLKPGLAVSINGTISRRGLRGAVPEGSEVHFLPALGGG